MTAVSFALVDSAFGRYGLAWTERGIKRVQLPGASDDATAARVGDGALRCAPEAAAVTETVDLLSRYFAGERVDFAGVSLDLDGIPNFNRMVYVQALRAGYGQITSYGEIARALGDVSLSRAVGQALGANPIPIIIPCHRVLAADGGLGGFSAPGGRLTKQRLLELEGAPVQLALL